jgi:hypothetical protein
MTTYGSLLDVIDNYYPNPNYVLYIDMSEAVTYSNTTWIFDTVGYTLTPSSSYVSGDTTFTYTIADTNNSLSSYGLTLTGRTGNTSTLLYNSSATNPSGGVISPTVNITGYDYILATINFLKTGYTEYNFTKTYIPEENGTGGYSILSLLSDFNSGEYGMTTDFAKYFMAFFISFSLGAGIIVATRNGMYGVVMFILALCFFALPGIGFIPWGFVIGLAFMAVGINFAISAYL